MNTQRVEWHTPKACPFCGSEPLLQEFPAHEHALATFMPDHEGSWAIECPGCGVGVCTDTEENALAIWNRRPANIERLEKVNEALVKYAEQVRDCKYVPDYVHEWSEAVLRLAKEPA